MMARAFVYAVLFASCIFLVSTQMAFAQNTPPLGTPQLPRGKVIIGEFVPNEPRNAAAPTGAAEAGELPPDLDSGANARPETRAAVSMTPAQFAAAAEKYHADFDAHYSRIIRNNGFTVERALEYKMRASSAYRNEDVDTAIAYMAVFVTLNPTFRQSRAAAQQNGHGLIARYLVHKKNWEFAAYHYYIAAQRSGHSGCNYAAIACCMGMLNRYELATYFADAAIEKPCGNDPVCQFMPYDSFVFGPGYYPYQSHIVRAELAKSMGDVVTAAEHYSISASHVPENLVDIKAFVEKQAGGFYPRMMDAATQDLDLLGQELDALMEQLK